jgi:antitoxin VapB
MALSIKNPRAEVLASEVARTTGETLTDAVIHALEERLERLRGRRSRPDLVARLTEIADRCRNLPDQDQRSPDAILGYDEHGTFEGPG